MPERLYQLRFDGHFKPVIPEDVTPEGFAGLEFDKFDKGKKLGRCVRGVAERVSIRSPNDVAQYLLTKVYVPFEDFDQEEMWVLLLDTKHQITQGLLHSLCLQGYSTIRVLILKGFSLLRPLV